jgi:hypothetical protein
MREDDVIVREMDIIPSTTVEWNPDYDLLFLYTLGQQPCAQIS